MQNGTKNRYRIALIANTAWYIYNFRRELMLTLLQDGHEIISISAIDKYAKRIQDEGFKYRAIPLCGSGINPIQEMKSICAIRRLFVEEKIDIVLSYTPKCNIYAGLAITQLPTQQIANISGLGRSFTKKSWLTIIVTQLYKLALHRATRIFFQNEDDRRILMNLGIGKEENSERIPGSGVDLKRFRGKSKLSRRTGSIFLLVARLLWDKGVGEFVQAAKYIRSIEPSARFQLLGAMGAANPSAIPQSTIDGWVREGIVEYLGMTDDVRPYLAAADCVVLPSYREGVPRSLLEAASMSRPIIATDAPGCRDVVEDGVTGYICRPRDGNDLAAKMEKFLSLGPSERSAMGQAGRRKMELEFDETIVIDRYRYVIDQLGSGPLKLPAKSWWSRGGSNP